MARKAHTKREHTGRTAKNAPNKSTENQTKNTPNRSTENQTKNVSRERTEKQDEIGQLYDVVIRDVSAQGHGVGRDQAGRAVFVPLTAPGDTVRAKVVQQQPRYWQGELVEVLEASSQRAEPRCGHFGICGGCDWQHLTPAAQVSAKQQILFETLRRVGKIPLVEPPSISSSARVWGCRDRARFHVDERGRLGFFARGSRQHIPISRCPVLHPSLQRLVSILREHTPKLLLPLHEICVLADDTRASTEDTELVGQDTSTRISSDAEDLKQGAFTRISSDAADLFAEGDAVFVGEQRADVLLSFHLDSAARAWSPAKWKEAETEFLGWFERVRVDAPMVRGVSLWCEMKRLAQWGEAVLLVGEEGVRYRAEGFAQASFRQNQVLREAVRSVVAGVSPRHLVEVYAGSGNLSFALAAQCERLLALEGNPQAVEDAQATLRTLRTAGRLPAVGMDILRFDDRFDRLEDICAKMAMKVDLLLVDPPRRGIAKEMMEQINLLRPPAIVYVSCDPATLARDLHGWIGLGYRLAHLEIVDLMPQTAHLEAVALLCLDNPRSNKPTTTERPM